MIDEMGGGLRHVPAIAGWAHPAPLARERDDKPLAAARTERTAEVRSRGCRTQDSRGVPPRCSPARAAPPGHATRASSQDAPTRSYGAVSSRGADARSGVPARGWHEAGGGAARETRRGQRPWAERRADGGCDRPHTTRGMPPPARRPLVAQQFRSRTLSVLPPEKTESFAFWPREAFFAAPRRSPGCGIRGRQESPAELAEALAWLADLGSVAADRICLMPQE